MSNIRAILWGLVQAVATVLFCTLAIAVATQIQKWEGPKNGFIDDLALLLLFVASALVSATLVLAYPAYLVLKQQINEGFALLLSTIIWLVLMLAGILTFIAFFDIHSIF